MSETPCYISKIMKLSRNIKLMIDLHEIVSQGVLNCRNTFLCMSEE